MSGDEKRGLPASLAARDASRRGDVAALIAMLSSSDARARISAAGQLRKLQDVSAVPTLVRCLQAPEDVGKVAALKALRDIGDPHSADAVAALAQDSSQPFEVRGTAAQTLLSFGDRRAVTALAGLFGLVPPKQRGSFIKFALGLLVESNGTEALPALRAARSEAGVMERRRFDRTIRTLERGAH